jgi:hypothetical protein
MTPDPQQQRELRKVIIRESHKATALTDGWLCFKYLDNGEESLSTFADISAGDVITYNRPHTPAPEQCPHWRCTDNLKSDFRDQNLPRFYCDVGAQQAAHPHTPAPTPNSSELIHLAEHDWHNCEERKGLHSMIPWTHGWITGFLTPNKPDWSKEHDAAIARTATLATLDSLCKICPLLDERPDSCEGCVVGATRKQHQVGEQR